jgi:hypothetical protein
VNPEYPVQPKPLLALLCVTALLSGRAALADDGHDHGPSPAAPTGPALPRFTATSELFELVGIVEGRRLTVYLDRYADNTPVPQARLDLEVGGAKVPLTAHGPGEFEGELPAALAPGLTAVTATVTADAQSDLLAGEFDVHEAPHAHGDDAPAWKNLGGWGIAAVLLMIALAATWRRVRTGAAA